MPLNRGQRCDEIIRHQQIICIQCRYYLYLILEFYNTGSFLRYKLKTIDVEFLWKYRYVIRTLDVKNLAWKYLLKHLVLPLHFQIKMLWYNYTMYIQCAVAEQDTCTCPVICHTHHE